MDEEAKKVRDLVVEAIHRIAREEANKVVHLVRDDAVPEEIWHRIRELENKLEQLQTEHPELWS